MVDFNEIENFASLLFTPKEICTMLDLDYDELEMQFITPGTEHYNAYWKGYLTTESLRRKKVIEMAKQGSTASQELLDDIINSNLNKSKL